MIRPAALSLYRPLTGARARIVAFTHAGGGASAFVKLRAALGLHHVELCPLQPPGRENRSAEPAHTVIEDMAQEFAAAVETLAPLPSAFLGHSLGGLTAYLTACRLIGKTTSPQHLVVSASLAPNSRSASGAPPNPQFYRERVLALGGIPDAILADPALLDMFTTIIVGDMKMGDAYRDRSVLPLACPITVYSGASDNAALPGVASAWQRFTAHRLRTRTFEGGHFFLYAEPAATANALVADFGWDKSRQSASASGDLSGMSHHYTST